MTADPRARGLAHEAIVRPIWPHEVSRFSRDLAVCSVCDADQRDHGLATVTMLTVPKAPREHAEPVPTVRAPRFTREQVTRRRHILAVALFVAALALAVTAPGKANGADLLHLIGAFGLIHAAIRLGRWS